MSVLQETTFTNKNDTRSIVDEVIKHAFESVCSTMGPNGNYVVINQTNRPKVTKDGVSVAKALDFNEARRNLIAKIITEPAIKTDDEVGDGTTTTVFQTYHLYNTFKDKLTFKNIRFLDKMIQEVVDFLGTLIIPGDIKSETFRKMLMTSSNYEEEIVNKILSIYQDYDKPNIRLVKAPSLKEDKVDLTKDIYFAGQFGSDTMVPRDPMGFKIQPGLCNVILIDSSIQTIDKETISTISVAGPDVTTVIVARNWDANAVNLLAGENQRLERLAFLPYKLQASGSLGTAIFNDLATLFNTRSVYDIRSVVDTDIVRNDIEFYLRSTGIYISKEQEVVNDRANEILEGIDYRYNTLGIVERQNPVGRELFHRISRLRANNVNIHVTGVTVSDAMERYYRYEDVMKAASTGLQYGVIPGIGYGYMEASEHLAQLELQSDGELEELRQDLIRLLTQQYTHLTGISMDDSTDEFGKYIDLVTGEVSDKPTSVFDNAAATMIALQGAWATAKTLGKTNNIMGRSNQSYM